MCHRKGAFQMSGPLLRSFLSYLDWNGRQQRTAKLFIRASRLGLAVAPVALPLPFPQSTTHSGKHLANRKGLVSGFPLFLSLPSRPARLASLHSQRTTRHPLHHQPQLRRALLVRIDSSNCHSFHFSRRPPRVSPLTRSSSVPFPACFLTPETSSFLSHQPQPSSCLPIFGMYLEFCRI